MKYLDSKKLSDSQFKRYTGISPSTFSLMTEQMQIPSKGRPPKASMNEELADRITREPTDDYTALYEQWSKSGAAVLLTGNIMVDRRYTSEARNVILDEKSDAHIFSEFN